MRARASSRAPRAALSVLAALTVSSADEAPPWERGEIDPSWAKRRATQTLVVEHDARRSPEQNGAALEAAIRRLTPGAVERKKAQGKKKAKKKR